jgi:hypothetical protein
MKRLTGKHILLLLLYSNGSMDDYNEPIEGRTRIVKMMFLFDKEIKKEFIKDSSIDLIEFPDFTPWKYGPFSKQIYDDIEFFINNEYIISELIVNDSSEIEGLEYFNWLDDFLVTDENEIISDIYRQERFSLTKLGMNYVEGHIYNDLTENQKEIVKVFKLKINTASLNAILRYTYMKYPEFTTKSEIKGSILGQ